MAEFLNFDDATAASHRRGDSLFQFKTLLEAEYQQPDQGGLFDMATGHYLPSDLVVASHIFLQKWHNRILRYTAFRDINDVRNGLLLYKPVEWAFNRAKMCIEVDDIGRMTFRLLDYDLYEVKLADKDNELRSERHPDRELNIQMTFGDLDKQEVRFPEHATIRPSQQLLGIHAIAAWVEAQSNMPNSEVTIPECNALDTETTTPSFNRLIQAWAIGVAEASELQQIFRLPRIVTKEYIMYRLLDKLPNCPVRDTPPHCLEDVHTTCIILFFQCAYPFVDPCTELLNLPALCYQ